MTNCERCCKEINEDEVQFCPECELDGLCDDCMGGHTCEREDEQP